MPKIKHRGKKGSGKELLYRSGGTKAQLRGWRALPKSIRKSVTNVAAVQGDRFDMQRTYANLKKQGTIAKYRATSPIASRTGGQYKGGASRSSAVSPVSRTAATGSNARTRNVTKIAAKVSERTGLTGKAARAKARLIRQGRRR